MKTRWPQSLLGLMALVVVCVHLSDGIAISRDKKETHGKLDSEIKLEKKSHFPKKYKSPIVIEPKKTPKHKLKISDLRPCISKAFCEVNSITEEPTYETSKEFYLILNRLKKFIDDAQRDTGSDEEDSGSSEESYEHYSQNGPHRSGPGYNNPHFYRRGKFISGNNETLPSTDEPRKSQNGTEFVDAKNATKLAKVYTPAQIEQRAFVNKKTQELSVVDDLAALIKISAEIGQALRSPRKCRSLFKKCRMSYEQIIRIFNRTQSIETYEPVASPLPTPLTKATTTAQTMLDDLISTTAQDASPSPSSSPAEPIKPAVDEEAENVSDGEGNRNKKSRTDFSEEDPEYVTDSEAESQPVKTYSLFSASQSEPQADNVKRDEVIVDEAFTKFEKVFPSPNSGNSKHQKLDGIGSQLRPIVASSEEEGSNESSGERPSQQSDYFHRSSAENDNQDSEEVEMEVPDKKVKTKHNTLPVKENAELAGEVDDTEDDSDAEIPSSEIAKQPEDDIGHRRVVKTPAIETESSEEASEEAPISHKKREPEGEHLFTRDEETNNDNGFNTYGFYPQVSPTFTKNANNPKKSVKSKGKKRKGNKKGQKNQDYQNSSEEERPDPPPPESEFYDVVNHVNGNGADGIPGKSPYNKKLKRKPGSGNEPELYSGEYQNYPHGGGGQSQGYGGGQSYGSGKPGGYGGAGYGGGYGGPQSNDQGPPPPLGGFFRNIMGWFSRGSKSSTPTEEQPGNSGGGGSTSYYGGNGSNKQPSTYDDQYQQNYGKPQKYSGEGYDRPSSGGYDSRPPQQYGGDRDQYPSSKGKPPRGRYPPSPRGRGDESSEEEEEDEEEDDVRPTKRDIQNRRPAQSTKSQFQHHSSSTLSVSGPPPPLVIVPPGEEADYPSQRNSASQKQEQHRQPQRKPVENSEEENSKEYSSEEKQTSSKKSQSSKNQKKKTTDNSDNNTVFSGIFGSAAEIDKQISRNKDKEDDENASLLLSTFDSITNTFSTSADKITDWSQEDNAKNKINVGSLASNAQQSRGRYKVNRNKNKNKNVGSFEVEDKNEKTSSEEEEDKK